MVLRKDMVDVDDSEYMEVIQKAIKKGKDAMDICVELEGYKGSHYRTMRALIWFIKNGCKC